MKRILISLSVLALITGCSQSVSDISKFLEPQGYTNVQTHGHAFFGCKEEDFKTKFTATAPDGHTVVEGVACKDLFGGTTIRFIGTKAAEFHQGPVILIQDTTDAGRGSEELRESAPGLSPIRAEKPSRYA